MRKALQALVLSVVVGSAFGADTFFLKDGDRVVFYGDSITDQRLYTVLTETYAVTRYPKLNATFIHSGWGGDRVGGGGGGSIDTRLQRDVLAYNPTVMTIMLGMNDGRYKPADPENDKVYFTGYEHIVSTVRKAVPAIRITVIQPSPYDDVTRAPLFPGGYNAVLLNYSKWLSDYARQNNLTVADLNTPVVDMLRKANATDPANASKILPDRVHPAIAGHLIMAEQLLKAWNARAIVASVSIDAADSKPTVASAEHATVTDLSSSNGIQWTEVDDALPLPFADWTAMPLMSLTINSSDITEALNQEPLKVTGLKPGRYTLQIDGAAVGTFTSDDLAKGVNLATLKTPMATQASDVYRLTVSHSTVHNDRWRSIQVPLTPFNLQETKSAMDSLDALEAALVAKQREAAQPKPHTFQIVPAA
jgi:lysophospholipase L1-like esterase